MGCTAEAVDLFIEHKQLFAPGKRQRRRCSYFRIRDDSERYAYLMDCRRGRR